MKTYIYHDNSNGGTVVFTCQAASILEADAQYNAETGANCVKQPHIGCQIHIT